MDYHKRFLQIAHTSKNFPAKFLAIGNIGELYVKKGDTKDAIRLFNQQLTLAKGLKKRSLEAVAHGNLGAAHRLLEQLDRALQHHNQELAICQETEDIKAECKAHGHLGNVFLSLGQCTGRTI